MKPQKHTLVFSSLAIMVLAAFSLMPAGATELIVNGNLESGTTGWTLSGQVQISAYASLYRSATHYLWFGGDNSTDVAYQDVTIPSSATTAMLSFYYNINTSQTTGTPDTFSATIRNTSGSTLATIANWSNLNGTTAGSYSQLTYNLLPFAGSTIRIYFKSICTLVGTKTTNFRVDDVSVSVTTVSCAYSLGSYSASPSSSSGSGSFNVAAGSECGWSASSDAISWLHTSSVGSGNGTVSYSFDGNDSSSSRTGHITVGGQTFTVNQAGLACSYSISPAGASATLSGGSASVSVTAGTGCGWSASSGVSWITITAGSSGTGIGTVSYMVAPDTSTSARTGTMTIAGQTFTITQAGSALRLAGIKIGVDPGHGGTDTGAVGPTGLTEKSVNLVTALALKQYLEAEGATVFLTRTTDVTVALTTRSSLFVNNAVDLAISVHHNAGAPSADTTMVFIYCGTSLATRGAVASDVVQRLGASTGIAVSQAPASTSDTLCNGRTDWLTGLTGVGQANLHMVREPEIGGGIPSILAEVSFITHPDEETKLRDADYLDKNGWAIYAGIADYFGFVPTPRGGNTDTTKPTISALGVGPLTINLGSSFTINYTVSDSGGSGLKQVQLWRASVDGTSLDPSWQSIGSAIPLSGNGPFSSTFTDTPLAAGNYWYGLHVLDKANNLMDERTAGRGPVQANVLTPCSYSLSSYSASPGSGSDSGNFGVTAGSGCTWSANTVATWIHTSSSGSGNGTVSYTIDANTSTSSRSGTITAGGQTFTITQTQVQLTGISLGNGVFRCVLSGPIGSTYLIQASSNLVDWLPLSTTTIPADGSVIITDSSMSGQTCGFYRAMLLTSEEIPANDLFANRIAIVGTSTTVVGANVLASVEPGEPFHWPSTGGKSVWWTWQAPQSGTVTISTAGSSFDTILAAYTGNSVGGLTLIQNNDDYGVNLTSQVSFFATSGTVYQIAVDGFGASSGSILLSLSQP